MRLLGAPEEDRLDSFDIALSRIDHPPVNLLGMYDHDAHARRRMCHEAALLRFVMPAETKPEVQHSKTYKRHSDDDDIVNKTLLELSGGDAWTPALCGYAHRLKRPKLQLYDDVVRNAMIGVY